MKLFRARFNQREGTPDSVLTPNPVRCYPTCDCLAPQYESRKWQELALHSEIQSTRSEAWKSLEAYIRKVAADGSDELNPIAGIGPEKWEQIVTLPPSNRSSRVRMEAWRQWLLGGRQSLSNKTKT